MPKKPKTLKRIGRVLPFGKFEKLPKVDIQIESEQVKAKPRTLKFSTPPDYKPGLQNKPDDFIVYHHTVPKKEWDSSGTSIGILPELIGLPWNEITMCFVLSLHPSAVRVSSGSVTADSCANRITIMVNNLKDRIITSISMEVSIPCPENYCGYDLQLHLDQLRRGDKTPYKTIHERSEESEDGIVRLGPGMSLGPTEVFEMPTEEEWQEIFGKKPPEEK